MARIARAVLVDYPHHITQHIRFAQCKLGNNRAKVFFAQYTRKKYWGWLAEYARKYQVDILAYCLMTNHIHLLAKPHRMDSLAGMMKGLNVKYTQFINYKYKRSGRIWAGRFYSCIVDAESYLWAVARYIEQNPLRAGMVNRIEDYPYSSARHHILSQPDEILSEPLFPEEQRPDYIGFVRAGIPDQEMEFLRYSTGRGKPMGDKKFIRQVEESLGRTFRPKRSGRPAKKGK